MGHPCILLGFYGHPCASQRHLTWTLLRRCCDISPLSPWLVLGDFNEVISHEDKIGGSRRVDAQINAFCSAIDTCKLCQIPFQGDRTTWTNKSQGNGNVKERLDYRFANSRWDTTFLAPSLTHLDFYHRSSIKSIYSLHLMISNLHSQITIGFEKSHGQEEACAKIILANWSSCNSSPLLQLTTNISNCASSLQKWHLSNFGNLKQEIKESHQHVSALQNSSSTDPQHFAALKNSELILDELLAKEEDYWHQRARISWMKSGDSNTKFFHQRANARSINNRIKKLRDEAGNTQTSEPTLLDIIQTYFQSIFRSQGVHDHAINAILEVIPTPINEQSGETISAPYTEADVFTALNSMAEDKSPGVDGACPSLTWRSIVWGKELLAKGLRWRVGNGNRIICKSDPWLPGHTEFTPFNFIGRDNSLQVADLITQHRQWDLTAISANFGQADIDRILSIPLAIYPSDDMLIWNGTNSGNYMVKSGYYFASSLAELNDPGSTFSSENWWTKFWKLHLPSKLRIFVWKVYHNVLPVAAELNRKHIAESPFCPLCKMQRESINHALFLCSRAKEVWSLSHLHLNFKLAATSTPEEFLLYASANSSTQEFELFLTICWSIWYERNAEYHGKLPKLAAAILVFATQYLIKYQSAHASTAASASPAVSNTLPVNVTPVASLVDPWIAPPEGKWKLNTDAACNKSSKLIGIGAVLRDSNGYIKAALSKSFLGCFKAEEMEATALALTLQWLLSLGLTADIIETDSLLVVQGLKAASECNSAFHTLLKDVNYLVSFFPRAQVTHVRRSANTYAHVLAKFALTVDTDYSWLEEFPPPLMTVM
uniref:RNase H type-1 domain-containing protein n=1 Tax=Cannabis sativa TaxID=3483 RepID=A0A803QEQ9_CANSA